MAVENKVREIETINTTDGGGIYWQKYAKPAAIVVLAAVIILGGWYGYQTWVVAPKEEQAQNSIFKAQQYFALDSANAALNGDGANKGFLYIINNYSGTKTANLAKYYAGVCYLKLGNFNKSIEYLKDFSTDAKQIQMMAYGCLGDAYSESKKNTEAIDAYKKAASSFDFDEANASEYLFRAAMLSEVTGKNKEALNLYKEVKTKFPATMRGAQVDKYIYRLSIEPTEFSSN